MGLSTLKTIVASALFAREAAAALPRIHVSGTKFYFENGTQFFMKGVAYQEDTAAKGGESLTGEYIDPLADPEKCRRDVPLLAGLGTNTIRTYAIDPTLDHDECMSLLDEAGIYVISDLSEPKLSVNRDDPEWNTDLFKRYTDVVDVLQGYSNVIGFFAGNEVSNNASNTGASAYVKAAVRDTKAYIRENVDHWMGVGYAANDDADIRANIAWYFNCGDQDEAIDYWGYNIYSWCGESTFERSGYDKQVEFFSNYSVPVFFAEYGCNVPDGAEGRLFQDTSVLYSDEMTDVFSGGIVYMYHQEENDYGLVSIENDEATTMKNYESLASRVSEADPTGTASSEYTPTNSPADCPAVGDEWHAAAALPPTPDSNLCSCMEKSLSCVAAEDLDEEDFGTVFGIVCGANEEACAGISANPETGVYGAYSMCSARQKLSFALDQYYQAQNGADSACDFEGQASLVPNPEAESSCEPSLSSAASVNSFAATATSAPVSTGTSGSDGGNNDDSGAAGLTMAHVAMGAYAVVAMFAGAAMIML